MNTTLPPTIQPLQLSHIALAAIHPSKTNPRKHFDQAKLDELVASIKVQGVLMPLVLRALADPAAGFELVAGERRLRAAKAAGLTEVPCVVRELTDDQALEIQMVENLQREDLSPLEEAESFQVMLDLKDAQQKRRYTVKMLAERFGRSERSIYDALLLLRLPGAARVSLEGGQLARAVAYKVARIPSKELRVEAAEQILAGALSLRQATALIQEKYMIELRFAPFEMGDATLVAAAGACLACPHMSDNCVELFDAAEREGFKKRKVCCEPGCFRKKVAALRDRTAAAAVAAGKVVAAEKVAKQVFPHYREAGQLDYNTDYVLVDQAPRSHELRVEPTKAKPAPSWAELAVLAESKVKGVKVPRVMIEDQRGVLRECVDSTLVKAAIEKSGEKIFRERSSGYGNQPAGPMSDKQKKERSALVAKNKANRAAVTAALDNAIDRLRGVKEVDAAAVAVVVSIAIGAHYRISNKCDEVAEALGIKLDKLFAYDDPSKVANLAPADALRLAAGCIAQFKAEGALQCAHGIPDELATVAAKHKAAAPSDEVLAKRADVKVETLTLVIWRMGIEKPAEIAKDFALKRTDVNAVIKVFQALPPGDQQVVRVRVFDARKGAPVSEAGKLSGVFAKAAARVGKVAALDAGGKAMAAVKGSMPAKKAGKGGKGK
jgi:ParB/RepB/Spo0J family partition protein